MEEENKKAEENIAQRKKDDATLKEQINATLDASAESQASVYRQEIAQAPLDSRVLYDQNAMQEAVNRKKIAESLANMGMTDSGLSSSMQTALTVQKSRGDNSVRAAEQQRIRAAESAIDQIFANNEQQKAAKSIEIDQATADYALAQKQTAEQNATQTATALYNAEVEAEATMYAADVEAQTKAASLAQDYQDKRAAMAQSYINNGVRTSEAWAQAYAAYPDTSTAEGVKYAYYAELRKKGYGVGSSEAVSTAYVNAILDGKSETQAQAVVDEAMTDAYEKELGKKGFVGLRRLGSATEVPTADVVISTYQSMVKTGLSAESAAYAIGCQFYNNVIAGDNSNANKVGQTLEQCFSGVQLTAALLGAGVE